MTDVPIIIPAIAFDGTLYPVEKMQAHIDGLFHLAVSVFVFNADRLLIQKRASTKYHCGGQWANTCCTHPHWQEEARSCAERRLIEELGFSVPLTEKRVVEYAADVGQGLREHEKVTMFTGTLSRGANVIRLNRDEVEDIRWVTASDLRSEIADTPEAFTPWLRIYVEQFPTLVF